MDKELLKQKVCSVIDENADRIIKISERILKNPELGFKEFKTAELIGEIFDELGIPYEKGLAITGVKGKLCGKKQDITVAVLAEEDAVGCVTHPDADPITGAAHACGHNAQLAAMIGSAIGLTPFKEYLGGNVCFFAVPAEEFIEIEARKKLVDDGKITYISGKQELINIGAFDDIDMAMMVHAQGNTPQNAVFIDGGSLGFKAKTIHFKGKAAHAGGAPYDGINALNAAMAALMCIHAQRETFKDEDKIRVHPIITNGGETVNVVPANVTMETYVRGANVEAIEDACQKVDRAIKGAAYAMGAEVEICDIKGYLPLFQDKELGKVFCENAKMLTDENEIYHGIDMVGSSDIGDLSHLLPCIQPTVGGYVGGAHEKEFGVCDSVAAFINPAKIMAMTVIDLLYGDAEKAYEIKNNFKPKLTKEEYLKF